MQYRQCGNTGAMLSALGFGMMRLPLIAAGAKEEIPGINGIDYPTSQRMLRDAVDDGLNYVDTAYVYHGGAGEIVTGRALADGYRDRVYLATKSPLWNYRSEASFDEFLGEQLKKLQTDHIDFYMLHGLNRNKWEKTALQYNAVENLFKAKADGRVRFAGFSFHDSLDTFKEIVDYAKWDFCQIQLNYMDVAYQAGIEGMKYAASKGLGVIIMEPLRGGYLAAPPEPVREMIGDGKTPVEWALDFLWDMPEVSTVLSGMSTPEQIAQNMEYAKRSAIGKLTQAERALYEKTRERFGEYEAIPCTGCAYCYICPRRVAIPGAFRCYNEYLMTNDISHASAIYNKVLPIDGTLCDECIKCHRCEEVCPQGIKITEWMPKIHELFSGK